MIVVLDTNVLVSGLISSFGPPSKILRLVVSGVLTLAFDARILIEYREVLNRPKFDFESRHVEDLVSYIQVAGQNVNAHPLRKNLPDLDDNMFLEVALAADAECLVTGNLRHFPAKSCEGMSVVSPLEFLQRYYQKSSKSKD